MAIRREVVRDDWLVKRDLSRKSASLPDVPSERISKHSLAFDRSALCRKNVVAGVRRSMADGRLVGPMAIVVFDMRRQGLSQPLGRERDDLPPYFPPGRTDEPFDEGIALGCMRRNHHDFTSDRPEAFFGRPNVIRIAVHDHMRCSVQEPILEGGELPTTVRHPFAVRMGRQTQEADFPSCEANGIERVMATGRPSVRGWNLPGRAVECDESWPMGFDESTPVGISLPVRSWRDPVSSEDIADGLVGDDVSEFGETVRDGLVAPDGVLASKSADQLLDLLAETGSSAICRGVGVGDELSMPSPERIDGDHGLGQAENGAAEGLGTDRQPSFLGVPCPRLLADDPLEHTDLLVLQFDEIVELLVDCSGAGEDEGGEFCGGVMGFHGRGPLAVVRGCNATSPVEVWHAASALFAVQGELIDWA